MNLTEDARQQQKKERRRASVSHKRRVRPEWQEPVSPVEVDKELAADGRQVTPVENDIRSEIGVHELIVKAHASCYGVRCK